MNCNIAPIRVAVQDIRLYLPEVLLEESAPTGCPAYIESVCLSRRENGPRRATVTETNDSTIWYPVRLCSAVRQCYVGEGRSTRLSEQSRSYFHV